MTRAERRRELAPIAAILLFAFALRLVVRAASGPAGFWKSGYSFYFELARSLATGHGYALYGGPPTAFRVPFYAIFIAGATEGRADFWSLLVAQALVSTGTVACAYALAGQLFDRRTALVAAGLTALYPYYAWHDTALQETGLLTFLTALSMVLLFAGRRTRSLWLAAATGLALGLAILTRSIILPFAAFAIVWLVLSDPLGHRLSKRVATAAVCGAMLCATLAPWLVRNHALTGHRTLSTEFGDALFRGNNARTFAFYPGRSIDLSSAAALAALSPADKRVLAKIPDKTFAQAEWFRQRGLAYIAAHPAAFVVNAVRKNIAAFGVLPSPRHDWKTDLLAAATYGPILLLAIIGLLRTRRRWRDLLPVYAQFVFFAGVTGVLWGHSSHRAYLDVYLIVFAASVLVAWWPRLRAALPSAPAPRPA